MLFATIMAGGSGTRFWPASRRQTPKQLLNLTGPQTMLQATAARLEGLCTPEQILVLTNQRLVEPTRQQLPQLPQPSIIGEPCKRDTAPCIGLAAAWIQHRDPEGTMLVMPADHVIESHQQFHEAVQTALKLLEEDPGRMVTFGIKPTYPAQVFGYIERGDSITGHDGFEVSRFCEKPDAATAEAFLRAGNFYWNSGIFVWRAATVLNALKEMEPEMMRHIDAIAATFDSDEFETTFAREFDQIVGKSIDYAVMEHYPNVCVVEAPFSWDDLGNWTALPRLVDQDDHGNTVIGKHLGIATADSIIRSENDHLVVTLGLKNCIVVHTPDATLIADKSDESAVREVVKTLENLGWEEYL